MYLLPAIDLLDGRAVRLAKGDYDAVTVYNDDPAYQAQLFEEAGATWLHVVDLDGAKSGNPDNLEVVLVPHRRHAAGQVGGSHARALRPAGHGGLAGLRVDAGNQGIGTELLYGRLGEIGVAHERGA